MKKWIKITSLVFAALGLFAASAVGGYFLGFARTGAKDAELAGALAVIALRNLEQQRLDRLESQLHDQLSSSLYNHWATFRWQRILGDDPVGLSGMRKVARYLRDHPTVVSDPVVLKLAACHLRPDLPDPHANPATRSERIASCYAEISLTDLVGQPSEPISP